MRRRGILPLLLAVLVSMALLQGCGGGNPNPDEPEVGREEERAVPSGESATAPTEDAQEDSEQDEAAAPPNDVEEESAASIGNGEIDAVDAISQAAAADSAPAGSEAESPPDSTPQAGENTLYLFVGEQTLTATLVENSSTAALKELLGEGPVTIDMHDYGNFEKVGELGANLPTNDESITTGPGDLILYQGKSFVIYYASNSWSFTRLGKIDGMTGEELKEILGGGDVRVTLSLG